MTMYVYRAVDDDVRDLDLRTAKPFPNLDKEKGDEAHHLDATIVVEALLASLPGGTVDAVLRLLLQNRASRLRVRWPS